MSASADTHRCISTHAPARGATCCSNLCTSVITISTHAPARGATMGKQLSPHFNEISTHAPARGATILAHSSYALRHLFQPTPLHEERRRDGSAYFRGLIISTHAPARGATQQGSWRSTEASYFNPRPCTRSDRIFSKLLGVKWLFQPTPLHEERRKDLILKQENPYHFNPRPCTRSDPTPSAQSLTVSPFQPTPLHEERQAMTAYLELDLEFQPTPLHEERHARHRRMPLSSNHFNPRPCTRSDLLSRRKAVIGGFQPTPLHEERRRDHASRDYPAAFQPTPLHEERRQTYGT